MFLSTNSAETLFVCWAASFAKCNKFNRPTPPVTFSFDRANGRHTGACRVLASLITSNGALTFPVSCAHLSAYPMSRKSGGLFLYAVAEPLRLSLSVLPGPQWLDVVPNTWASASAEVLLLQYSFVTGHFLLGVSCIVPGTSCLSTARNTTKAPVTTLL